VRIHFSDLEMRYTGRMVTGTGRPGIAQSGVIFAAADAAGPNILAAPNGALTLTGVAVTTHQISISLPIR
jgi:acyl-coenzyme A thioesterase PaaI-like protein